MIRRPPRSTQSRSSAASDVYKRQHLPAVQDNGRFVLVLFVVNRLHLYAVELHTDLLELLLRELVEALLKVSFAGDYRLLVRVPVHALPCVEQFADCTLGGVVSAPGKYDRSRHENYKREGENDQGLLTWHNT